MYGTAPDVAKELLFAYMYRSANSPLFRGVAQAGAMITKATLYAAVDGGDDIRAIRNIDTHGNMTSVVEDLKKFRADMALAP